LDWSFLDSIDRCQAASGLRMFASKRIVTVAAAGCAAAAVCRSTTFANPAAPASDTQQFVVTENGVQRQYQVPTAEIPLFKKVMTLRQVELFLSDQPHPLLRRFGAGYHQFTSESMESSYATVLEVATKLDKTENTNTPAIEQHIKELSAAVVAAQTKAEAMRKEVVGKLELIPLDRFATAISLFS
jgi:hypothetical protein